MPIKHNFQTIDTQIDSVENIVDNATEGVARIKNEFRLLCERQDDLGKATVWELAVWQQTHPFLKQEHKAQEDAEKKYQTQLLQLLIETLRHWRQLIHVFLKRPRNEEDQ